MAPSRTMLPVVALLAALGRAARVPRADSAATTSVMSVFMPGFDTQAFDGSIVSAGPSMTVVAVNCPPGEDASDCGLGDSSNTATITQGASEAILSASYGGATIGLTCQLDVSNAVCSETYFGTAATSGLVSSSVGTISDYTDMMLPVTITAGLDKLAAAGGSGASATNGASAVTTTAAADTGSTAASGASKTQDTTSPAATGAAAGIPRPTQNAVLLAMAAAAFIGAVVA